METQNDFTVYTEEPLDIGVAEEATEGAQPTEADTQSEKAEDTPTPETAKDEAEPTEAKESNTRYQKRIDKLVKQREEYAREAEALRKELESIKSLPKKSETEELDPLSFDSYEDYIEALNSQPKTEPKEVKEESQVTETQRKLDDVFDEAREKYEDFDKVVLDNSLPFTPTMVVALTELESAGEIAYYLAQHKDELKEIAKLTPTKQVIALDKVADKLRNPIKVEKKVTKAPDPINPVQAKGDVSNERDPSKMSFKEYEAYMNNQTRNKKGFW